MTNGYRPTTGLSGLSRRGVLFGVTAAASASFLEAAAAVAPAVDGGRKFMADGRVRGFAGNTLICHLPQQGADSAAFNALLDIYRTASNYPFLANATLLPPSSYHMTIFGGANDQGRGKPGQWPQGVPADLPLEACHRLMAERLKGFRSGLTLPIRMTVDLAAPTPEGGAITLPLLPVDAAQSQQLRVLRRRLSEATGIRISDPDTYGFHISLAYWIKPLTPEQAEAFDRAHRQWRATLSKAAPVIALGAPEFCVFKDMFAFERQFYLE